MDFSLLSAAASAEGGTPAWAMLAYLASGVFFILAQVRIQRDGERIHDFAGLGKSNPLLATALTAIDYPIFVLDRMGVRYANPAAAREYEWSQDELMEMQFEQLVAGQDAREGIREVDGLAMSSRNVRLTAEGRAAAPIIYRALSTAKSEAELRQILSTEKLLELDYATFIDEETFLPADQRSERVRAIVAGWINGVRLLDNMHMEISA